MPDNLKPSSSMPLSSPEPMNDQMGPRQKRTAAMKGTSYLDKDYKYFIGTDLSEYEGKYIAIHDGKVQIASPRLKEVYNFMKRNFPDIIPFITQVQSGQAMVL